ncbi:MAG: hydroxyisourate hydrolase [Ignavibacteria bacterium]|nr:hydroxyisourate hydrolase [Ignavibacteria bacterium]
MSRITTHVLDTSSGRPASGISIQLFLKNDDGWKLTGEGMTDENGRISDMLKTGEILEPGIYKMKFETELYFKEKDIKSFYPYVEIIFNIDSEEHYHIPLLLSPYGYSTYRGS